MQIPRFTMRAPDAVIRLDGEILPGAGAALSKALGDLTGRPVALVINSPGGVATEGAAMAAEIERHGKVNAYGQGIVASAATLPFTAAHRKVLHAQCVFMIHDPAALAFGPAQDMRKRADDLDTIAWTYAAHYARVSGQTVATVRDWMIAETWLTPDEALALRFCDGIEHDLDPAPVARADYTAFRHAPAALVRMTAANGWATASPDNHED